MDFILGEELLMLIPGLVSGIPAGLFGMVTYVLRAMAIHTFSVRRGLHKLWLAWGPVLNVWLLGSLSDQYQYVVRGENKSRRKWLLILQAVKAVLTLTVVVLVTVAVAGFFFSRSEVQMMSNINGPMTGILAVILPLAAASIAYCVIRFMALYDVYRSAEPANSTLYLILSILFRPIEPLLLFFNRDKDLGMPPRKQQPVYEQVYTWEPMEDAEYR